MFNKQLTGTRAEIESELKRVVFPHEVLAPDAVRDYVMAHIPKHTNVKYRLVLNVQSIASFNANTLAGHISVVVTA